MTLVERDRPADHDAQGTPKDDVAQEVAVARQAGERDIGSNHIGGTTHFPSEVLMQDRRGREYGRGMSGREGIGPTRVWTLALDCVLRRLGEGVTDDLSPHEVPTDVCDLVIVRGPANGADPGGHTELEERIADHASRLRSCSQGGLIVQVSGQILVIRLDRQG